MGAGSVIALLFVLIFLFAAYFVYRGTHVMESVITGLDPKVVINAPK